MAKTGSSSAASIWISGFVVVLIVLTSFALLRDLRASGAAASTDEQAFVVPSQEALPQQGGTTTVTAAEAAPAATEVTAGTLGLSGLRDGEFESRRPDPRSRGTVPPETTTTTTTVVTTTTLAPPSTTTTTTSATTTTTTTPQVGGIPDAGYVPDTVPYTGPMTYTSGNQPDGGLIIEGFEITGAMTIDAGHLPYLIVRNNNWHIPNAPSKALRVLGYVDDILVQGNRFDGGGTNGGDVVAINSPGGLSHAEVVENLFVDIDASEAHVDIVVTFWAEMNVRRNRFANVQQLSSAVFYQSINGPTWGVVEDNVIVGDNHLIRAQSRKAGSGPLVVTDNVLDGPVSWIDPSWDGFLTWTGNSGGYEFHAA